MTKLFVLRDFDTCKCGDYRRDHVDGIGPCRHNKPRDMTHGYKDCTEFRLSSEATELPSWAQFAELGKDR